jgi:hypothetical protein
MKEFKGTPGPWRWELNLASKHLNLCGGESPYDLTVMDFTRWGMGGALPRFNVDHGNGMQLMERAETLAQVVKGREHHARWFQDINHPDAKLIAAAPELLAALQNLVHLHMCEQGGLSSGQPSPADWFKAVDQASQAITKAIGESCDE